MSGKQEIAYAFRIIMVQYIADGEKVAEGFRHFFLVYHNHTGMNPVVNVLSVMGTAGLRNFIFMMREH